MTTTSPVIVYDGECRFCDWSVRRIQKLDRHRQFEYLPRQAPGVESRFPVLAASDFNTGLRLIDTDATIFVGADAVHQIYRRMPPYHLLAWIYRVPVLRQFFRVGYGLVARNRHRFGRMRCDPELCTVPYGERQIDTTSR
jgi:predicted DCC family thiol-disulfide oxidoreductase YuxK